MSNNEGEISIFQATHDFIDSVNLSRSKNTADTYRHALGAFNALLNDNKIDVNTYPVKDLSEEDRKSVV